EELRCTPGDEFDKDVLDGTLSGFADLVYSTLAYALDNTTGQILDRLDEHGLTNNTIIVFASDNGGTTSGDNWPFTGSKHTLWEGGIHVPAAIWWPGTLDAGTAPYSPGDNSYSYMTQYFDWYPTLMAMTGSTLNGTDLDGLNLYSNLLSRTATRSGFDDCYFGLDSDWGTVRTERWKLHFNRIPGNQKIELYDLNNDIDESNNVQASYPVERDTLIALFDQWFDSGAVSSNYMPLHEDNISYPLPAPNSDILEVQATQTDSISNPNDGVYVRYAKSETRDYDNYIHANDQFQFDIYVADDSDHIDGIYCTPGNGWVPTFDTNNGVNSEGELATEKSLLKGQWVRQVFGMGCRAALPSPVQYIALRNTSAGYYHFYIDNVIIREADGTIRDVVWDQDGDFDVNLQYRYKGIVYYSWEDVTAISGFPFSNITLNTVDLSTLPGGGSYCDDGTCDPGEDQCNCPEDCGTPPSTETSCDDGIDEDCDTYTDCDDSDCDGDPACPPVGVDRDWTNGGADRLWRNSANWSGGAVPNSLDKAAIRNVSISGPIIDSSTTALAANMVVGDFGSTADSVDMTGGSLTDGGWLILGYGAVNNGTFTISSGTADIGGNLLVGFNGAGTIDMTGGSITIGSTFGISWDASALGTSTGSVFLDGGTISAGAFTMKSDAAMDITDGTLIVNGDATATINTYIGSGWITGYDGGGTVNVDYDVSNAGKTTVTASNVANVNVPDVVGLAQATAESDIVAAGLVVGTVTTAYSGSVPAGDVISQNPVGSTSVEIGSSVDIEVSLGLAPVTVPDVVGLSQATAESDIVTAGLVVGTVTTESSETVPAGDVISQNPTGGASVPAGSSVDLVVST
ncbi:MAG: PASTA domain-containing protein, partial [Planctomycetes bacterium]|nr:PASTA domain-containing protein [Planctomycetota bacterium]